MNFKVVANLVITLPIPRGEEGILVNMLEGYFKPEEMNDPSSLFCLCEKCETPKVKSLEALYLPQFLILQLLRFDEEGRKRAEPVAYPDTLDEEVISRLLKS